MIAMIDNYDSFTFNLVQYLRELAGEEEVWVVRNDAASPAQVLARRPRAIVVSPGPGVPEAAGMCVELFQLAAAVPMLGVCLGHQAMTVAYGGRVVRAGEPRHGKVSAIRHGGTGLFAGIPDPFEATRYHSLIAERATLPAELVVTAWTEDGLVMGLAHASRPHWGVQFHPESYLTRHGKRIVANFLAASGGGEGREGTAREGGRG
jgi:anthranilate synthase component 2